LLTRVGIDYYPLHPKYYPFLLSEWISAVLSLKKAQRRRGDRDDDERWRGAKQRTTPRTRIEENQNAKMATKRETTMSAGQGPSGSAVNPMPKTRVLDWILLDSDEGPSSGKEERAGEGAAKWARGMPHVCEHKCPATMKRCRGSGEEGVEDLISDSGNNYDDGKASISESHYLFTCSIDGA
jgi:hypothetical protein